MKAPKRMFPNGLKTVSTTAVKDGAEITRKEREKLTRGVKEKFSWMDEKSYWDHETKTVKTVQIRKLTEQEKEIQVAHRIDRRRRGRAKFPLPPKERFF